MFQVPVTEPCSLPICLTSLPWAENDELSPGTCLLRVDGAILGFSGKEIKSI